MAAQNDFFGNLFGSYNQEQGAATRNTGTSALSSAGEAAGTQATNENNRSLEGYNQANQQLGNFNTSMQRGNKLADIASAQAEGFNPDEYARKQTEAARQAASANARATGANPAMAARMGNVNLGQAQANNAAAGQQIQGQKINTAGGLAGQQQNAYGGMQGQLGQQAVAHGNVANAATGNQTQAGAAVTNAGNQQMAIGSQQAANTVNAIGSMVGTAASFIPKPGGAGAGGAGSDERLKKNIKHGAKLLELTVGKIDPVKYRYKNPVEGVGEQAGVMAQDLEKTPLKDAVVKDADGMRRIDGGKLALGNTAMIKELNDKVDKFAHIFKAIREK